MGSRSATWWKSPSPRKPPWNLAIIRRYVLTPAVFDCLAKTGTGAGGELQLTDGMRLLLKIEKMYAYVYEGRAMIPATNWGS